MATTRQIQCDDSADNQQNAQNLLQRNGFIEIKGINILDPPINIEGSMLST